MSIRERKIKRRMLRDGAGRGERNRGIKRERYRGKKIRR
jgi:hypothetical protein